MQLASITTPPPPTSLIHLPPKYPHVSACCPRFLPAPPLVTRGCFESWGCRPVLLLPFPLHLVCLTNVMLRNKLDIYVCRGSVLSPICYGENMVRVLMSCSHALDKTVDECFYCFFFVSVFIATAYLEFELYCFSIDKKYKNT